MAAPFEKNVVSHMNVLIFLIFSSLSWQKKKKKVETFPKRASFQRIFNTGQNQVPWWKPVLRKKHCPAIIVSKVVGRETWEERVRKPAVVGASVFLKEQYGIWQETGCDAQGCCIYRLHLRWVSCALPMPSTAPANSGISSTRWVPHILLRGSSCELLPWLAALARGLQKLKMAFETTHHGVLAEEH